MKMKAVLTGMMATVVLAAGACSMAQGAIQPKQANIQVTIDEFMSAKYINREVTIPGGGALTVTLGSNPTTGYSWNETAQIANPAALQQTASQFVPSEGKGIVGAPGEQVWTFKALQKGTTTVGMEYGQPWVGGAKGAWTFELTVTVE